MRREADPEVTDPKRMRQFVGFFKNYMGLSTFVVAAMPIPVGSLQLIPVYRPDVGSTSVITSLICFLLLSFVFYSRHGVARILFPDVALRAVGVGRQEEARVRAEERREKLRHMGFSSLIVLLILATLFFFFFYQSVWMGFSGNPGSATVDTRLRLMISYTGFFASAEAAFVLMATREYLQDMLQLSDTDQIMGMGMAADVGAGPSGAAMPQETGVTIAG